MMKRQYFKGNTDWYAGAFKDFENRLNGQKSGDIHQLRKKAIQTFLKTGYPSTKNEEWKYTDISAVAELDFKPAQPVSTDQINRDDIQKFLFEGLQNSTLVFINGHFRADLSGLKDIPASIKVMSLQQALEQNDHLLEQNIAQHFSDRDESFVSLNTAFMQDGTYIHIPDAVVVEQPLHLLYLSLPGEEPPVSFPRNLIIAGASSQVRIVESYTALKEGEYFTNSVSEIILEKNAHLERYRIQDENLQAFHISNSQISQQRDSRFTDLNLNFGSHLVRNNITATFDDQNGNCVLNGLYVGGSEQLIDNHTNINHAKPHCESHELYKGILDDKARGIFNGKIFVRKDAQKTNAIQANNCILLSDSASIDTKPQLEIFADDVKCTHGATIGQLNEEAFFYMRARGIEKTKARNLLIYAFASEVLDQIEIDSVRDKVAGILAEKLHAVRPVWDISSR